MNPKAAAQILQSLAEVSLRSPLVTMTDGIAPSHLNQFRIIFAQPPSEIYALAR